MSTIAVAVEKHHKLIILLFAGVILFLPVDDMVMLEPDRRQFTIQRFVDSMDNSISDLYLKVGR